MNTQIYEQLENTDISWYCCNCGLPNFNTSFFEDFVELSTPTNSTTDTDGSILDISTMGPPLTTSSPKNKPKQQLNYQKEFTTANNKLSKHKIKKRELLEHA
jgi:hypothetical protein